MRRRSTIGTRLGVVLGLVVLLAWPLVREAGATASSCTQFVAVAAADGARLLGASPGFALVEEADVAAPGAQAYVDASGRSDAYAGYPYPGSTALSALALGGVPSSAVPLVAASSHPAEPEGKASAPGVTLMAQSTERDSTASARGGASSDDSDEASTMGVAHAGCADDGTVRARSESVARSLRFGGEVIRVGELHASAEATVGADGKPRVSSTLVVTGLVVLGQAAELTDRGLAVAGASARVPADPFVAGLRDAGVTVTYLASSTDADGAGVVAPGVQISVRRQAVGTGPTEVVYTLGRSYARATSGALPTGASTPSFASGATSVASSTSSGGGVAALGTAASAPSASGFRRVLPVATRSLDAVSTARIYPVLVVGAIGLLVGTTLLRRTRPKRGAP